MKCERGGCDEKVKAHGLCQRHYDRERSKPRRREDRVLTTRARNRAVAELISHHRDEFAELFKAALEDVHQENQRLQKVAEQVGAELTDDRQVLRLKRGPKADDQEVEDRIDYTPKCESCDTYHSTEHHCLFCGALPARAIYDEEALRSAHPVKPLLVPAGLSDERIKAAVEAGKRKYPDQDDKDEEDEDDGDLGGSDSSWERSRKAVSLP